MDKNIKKSRSEAARLFRMGLLLCKKKIFPEERINIAGLWQKAIDIYIQNGDTNKAEEIKSCFSKLKSKTFNPPSLRAKNNFSHDSVISEFENKNFKIWSKPVKKEKFKDWHIFLKIGCFGFGGPLAIWGLLHEEMVRRRKILSNQDFLEAAVLGDILPGPVTMDIVTYTGYKLSARLGAAYATFLFILPSFLIMLVVAAHYDQFMNVSLIKHEFRYLGAAVTAIIISVGLDLSKQEVKEFFEVGVLLASFISSLIFEIDMFWIIMTAGAAGLLLEASKPADGNFEQNTRDLNCAGKTI